jgi:cysteinyl-tRNA synthetase
VRDLVKEGFDPIAIRYLLISTHYRAPANFTKEGLKGAWESVVRIRQFVRRMEEAAAGGGGASDGSRQTASPAGTARDAGASDAVTEAMKAFEAGFGDAVDDDLNMSQALAHVFDYMREINRIEPTGADARRAGEAMCRADKVLGLLKADAESAGDAEIDALVQERTAARKARDFARSDQIRDELAARGIVIEDTPQGVRWYRK